MMLLAENGIVGIPNCSDAEQLLLAAFPDGRWVDLRAENAQQLDPACGGCWSAGRTVRAEVIRAVLLGAVRLQPGQFGAVRLRGARVSGRLDLIGATVACAFVCEYCHFDTTPRFVETTTRTVRITCSELPAFDAARMHAEGVVSFHRSVIGSALRLDRARVVGEVNLREAEIGDGSSPEAVAANGLTVDGDLDFRDMVAHGAVTLRGSRISGSVHGSSAVIRCPGSVALDGVYTSIGGGFDADRLTVEGETKLSRARIAGTVHLAGARLDNPGGISLRGTGLMVDGAMWCDQGFSAAGEARLLGAKVAEHLILTGAKLSNPNGTALRLDRAALADIDASDLFVTAGDVSLRSAQIAGRVNLSGARLHGERDTVALVADGVTIGNELILAGISAQGEIRARIGHVQGRVRLSGARIDNPGGIGLRLSRAEVDSGVFCHGMTVSGQVTIHGAKIGGLVDLSQVCLINPGGIAVDGRALQATQLALLPADQIQGSVILSHARLGVLRDDPDRWPEELQLDGLSYDALEPALAAIGRLAWLARDPRGHPQPYEQLAAHYSNSGQPVEARRVLYAKERRQRATKTTLGRAWDFAQDVTVGYGYQPWRAALWFLALLAIGTGIFAATPPSPVNTAGSPHFSPFVYTLDLLLPIVDLGQKHAFNPAGTGQWFSYLLVAAGWILATTIATGVARVITRR